MGIPGASTAIRKGGQELIERLGKVTGQKILPETVQNIDYAIKAGAVNGTDLIRRVEGGDLGLLTEADGIGSTLKRQAGMNSNVNNVINPPAQPNRLDVPVEQKVPGTLTRKQNQATRNVGRTKEDITNFQNTKKAQEAIGSHHHIDDLEFVGNALNRTDDEEIISEITRLRGDTEFGDRKSGLIGAMDQKTYDFRMSGREDISKQIEGFDDMSKVEQDRLLNDLQKEAKDTGDIELARGQKDVLDLND